MYLVNMQKSSKVHLTGQKWTKYQLIEKAYTKNEKKNGKSWTTI